jgi:RNA polymerase sigma-70 factor, ECF subfamily
LLAVPSASRNVERILRVHWWVMASTVRGTLSSPSPAGVSGGDSTRTAALRASDPIVRAVNSHEETASNRTSRELEAEQDRVLIESAQSGDKLAFKQLVQRHQRRAFAIALGLLRDEQDAREVVQEAFLRVHRGLDSFQGGSSFFTWLYRIVTNLSIDLIRKPSRREAELDETRAIDEADIPLLSRIDGADPLDVLRRAEIRNKLEAALDALPPYHRGVIVMREVEGMSYEEMAEAMGVSKGTIMSRLFHARQKLQRSLADCYAEEIAPLHRSPKP